GTKERLYRISSRSPQQRQKARETKKRRKEGTRDCLPHPGWENRSYRSRLPPDFRERSSPFPRLPVVRPGCAQCLPCPHVPCPPRTEALPAPRFVAPGARALARERRRQSRQEGLRPRR